MDQSNLKMTSDKSESSTRIIEEDKEKEKKSESINRRMINHLDFREGLIYLYSIQKLFTNLLIIFLIISHTTEAKALKSMSNIIYIKFNSTGTHQVLNSEFLNKPNRIYINETQLEEYSDIITINSISDKVKLEWDNNINTCSGMFKDLIYISEIDLTGFDSSLVVDTSRMFLNCKALTSLNLNGFITSKVTNMKEMFYAASNLTKIDVSSFDTSLVNNMEGLFRDIDRLTSLDVSNFNTRLVKNMATMFREMRHLRSLDLSNFDTSNCENMYGFFSFDYALTSVVLSSFDTSKVVYFAYFFESCRVLTSFDVSNFDTSSGVHYMGMFQNSGIKIIDISHFKTEKAYKMENLFNGCRQLTSVNFGTIDLSNVITFSGMFQNCESLTSLNISFFNTKSVIKFDTMFNGCIKLTSIDVSSFDTSKAINMHAMFCNCNSLTSLNITNFDTSNVQNMMKMFKNCNSLTTLNLQNFDTSEVTTMQSMFEGCKGLTYLNISNFITINCQDYSSMFIYDNNLKYVNFYNYYENDTTNFNDIIKETHIDIKLCVHVTKEARIFIEYRNNIDERCLDIEVTDKITTNRISPISTGLDLETHKLTDKITENELPNKSTNNITPESPISEKSTNINIKQETSILQELENINNSEKETIIQKYTNIDSKNFSNSIEPSNIDNNKETSNKQESTNLNDTPKINSIISEFNSNSEMTKEGYTNIVINDNDYSLLFQGYNNSYIYTSIIQNLLQSFSVNKKQKIYIKTDNGFTFEITTEEAEKDLLNNKSIIYNYSSSIIDLGECKNLLKQKYFPDNDNISLIILKHEKITNNIPEKYVQYEIYEPFNRTKLDLSICNNVSIEIIIPNAAISESTQKMIKKLQNLGYDIFNINDPFYTDFCTKYTTEDGTDMTLADRKKYIYEAIMKEIQCQSNCEFSNYYPENRNIECSCKVEEKIDTVDYKKFSLKKLYNTFYDVLKYSNYKVIFCYKLVFDTNNFNYNKGFWIIFILFFLYVTQLIRYIY